MSPKPVSASAALRVARSKKVFPTEVFSGNVNAPWEVKCDICSQNLSTTYLKLHSAKEIGCIQCGKAQGAKKRGYRLTKASLENAGWELISPLSSYTNMYGLVDAIHIECRKQVRDVPQLLKLKRCQCEIDRAAAKIMAEGVAVARSHGGELLEKRYSGAREIANWKCSEGHTWPAQWGSVVGKAGTWCPFCSGRRAVTGVNDLATVNPILAGTFDRLKNAPLLPEELLPYSNKKVWWTCRLNHSYQATLSNRHGAGDGCPYCSNHKVLSGFNDLKTKDPEVAKNWHPTKNTLGAHEVTQKGNIRVWWLCENGHETFSYIPTRVDSRGRCSVCSGRELRKGLNDLSTVRPDVAKLWHPTKNGDLMPGDVLEWSNKWVWWLCQVGHDWRNSVHARSGGRGCPYCAYKKCWPGFNDLATTHSHLLKDWDYEKNTLDPTKIIAGGGHLVHWLCERHGGYETTTVTRAFGSETGCPSCAESGYRIHYRGLAYFIENKELNARKIGITNTHKTRRRLEGFQQAGWTIVSTWEHESGIVAKLLETALLKTWIRGELQLPAFLARQDMSNMNGHSETFSWEGPTNFEVCQKADGIFKTISRAAEINSAALIKASTKDGDEL